jgi:hypothetical protein
MERIIVPIGKNNTDLNTTGINYLKGTPITIPHEFSTPILEPHDFGNDIPVSDPTLDSNPVTWTPTPEHFGNLFGQTFTAFGFELEDGSGVLLLESGDVLLLEVQ